MENDMDLGFMQGFAGIVVQKSINDYHCDSAV